MAVVRTEPEMRANKIGRSPSNNEIAASEELRTTQRFVLANNAEPRKGRNDIHAYLPRSLPKIRNDSFVRFERHAFLQLPPQQGNRFC